MNGCQGRVGGSAAIRWLWLVAAVAGSVSGCVAGVAAGDTRETAANVPTEAFSTAVSARYVGAWSCAATACHGAVSVPNLDRQSRSEFTFWLEYDPHARAARALTSPLGLRMMTRLGILKDGQVVDASGYRNCEACHNLRPEPEERLAGFAEAGEGVSCEACHGAAEHWRTEHYRQGHSAGDLWRLGMVATKDWKVRTQVCIGCHVAGRGEVNHDLIAAGHPVLKFEMAAYHDLYPKHWRAERERQLHPDMAWQLWVHGQRQAAVAVLEQLCRRAEDERRPWPELAEWSCFACHHDLVYPSWRAERGYDRRKPGSLPMARWYLRWLDKVATHESAPEPMLDQVIEELRGTLETSIYPDRQAVAEKARRVLERLRSVPENVPPPRAAAEQLWQQLRADDGEPTSWFREAISADWDVAAQAYLLLRAVAESTPWEEARKEWVRNELATLQQQLAFPRGWNSPREQDIATAQMLSSPAAVLERLRSLAQFLSNQQ